ncbi:hypothetical protein GCM10009592_28700 [Brachybacterium rhamnosum]|uniref:Phage tail protein n=1 Tax=Brachybacterium rhamnosum TaxID=173361 RepID=A0ABW4Q212_9MICO
MSVPITTATENTWIDSDNARIYGGDLDSVWVGDHGAVFPAGDDIVVPENHDNIGWLSEDGLNFAHNDNTETFNGHQGGKVVRKKVTTSEDTFTFTALETTLLTFGLINDVKSYTTTGGVSRLKVSGSKKSNDKRSWIVDTWDGDIWYRYLIPSGEVGERPEEVKSNSAITMYELAVTVYGGYEILTNDPAMAKPAETP